jgi:hypothetical protein
MSQEEKIGCTVGAVSWTTSTLWSAEAMSKWNRERWSEFADDHKGTVSRHMPPALVISDDKRMFAVQQSCTHGKHQKKDDNDTYRFYLDSSYVLSQYMVSQMLLATRGTITITTTLTTVKEKLDTALAEMRRVETEVNTGVMNPLTQTFFSAGDIEFFALHAKSTKRTWYSRLGSTVGTTAGSAGTALWAGTTLGLVTSTPALALVTQAALVASSALYLVNSRKVAKRVSDTWKEQTYMTVKALEIFMRKTLHLLDDVDDPHHHDIEMTATKIAGIWVMNGVPGVEIAITHQTVYSIKTVFESVLSALVYFPSLTVGVSVVRTLIAFLNSPLAITSIYLLINQFFGILGVVHPSSTRKAPFHAGKSRDNREKEKIRASVFDEFTKRVEEDQDQNQDYQEGVLLMRQVFRDQFYAFVKAHILPGLSSSSKRSALKKRAAWTKLKIYMTMDVLNETVVRDHDTHQESEASIRHGENQECKQEKQQLSVVRMVATSSNWCEERCRDSGQRCLVQQKCGGFRMCSKHATGLSLNKISPSDSTDSIVS